MVLVAVTVVVALLVGAVRGGRLSNLATAPLRGGILVVGAAVAQFLHAVVPVAAAGVVLTGASQAALLTFLWWNRYLAGAVLVAIGSSLNTAVILANGAMPVSREAMVAVSRHPEEVSGARHRLLADGDALAGLADIIPLPLLRTVVSVGDVVLAAGVALLVVALMTTPSPPESPGISRAARRRSR